MSLLEALLQPFTTDGLLLTLLVEFAILWIMATSLDLAIGYAGLFQLGHVGFFSLGALGTLLGTHAGWLGADLFTGLLLGFLFTSLAVLLAGLPTLRLTGDYFAIVTLGLGIAVQAVLMGVWANGVPNVPSMNPLGCDTACMADSTIGGAVADAVLWLLQAQNATSAEATAIKVVLCLALAIGVHALFGRLKRAPFGRALRAVREDRHAAASLGKNVQVLRFQALWISALAASLAGSLWVHHLGIMAPREYSFQLMVLLVVTVIIGGLGSHKGALIGAIIVTVVDQMSISVTSWLGQAAPDATSSFDLPALRIIIFAALLLTMMLWRPQGMLGDEERRWRDLWRRS